MAGLSELSGRLARRAAGGRRGSNSGGVPTRDPVVLAELRYYPDDPFVVPMLLSIDHIPATCWTFSRDLLITGAAMPSGAGDVQVYPTHDGMIIELSSGGYATQLLAYTPDIARFIDRTLTVVPVDAELDHYDIDGELMVLLTAHDSR